MLLFLSVGIRYSIIPSASISATILLPLYVLFMSYGFTGEGSHPPPPLPSPPLLPQFLSLSYVNVFLVNRFMFFCCCCCFRGGVFMTQSGCRMLYSLSVELNTSTVEDFFLPLIALQRIGQI